MTRTEQATRAWRARYVAEHGLEALRAYRAAEARRWRERHPEEAKAKEKRDRERRDKQKLAATMRSWRDRNADHVKAYEAAYWKAHPDEFRLKCQRRERRKRSRKRKAEGTFTKADIDVLFIAQDGKCAGCHKAFIHARYEIDHKRPLAKGGSNWPSNLQLLCRACNARKHTADFEDWVQKEQRP